VRLKRTRDYSNLSAFRRLHPLVRAFLRARACPGVRVASSACPGNKPSSRRVFVGAP
jgi:hypothetical protein